MFEAQEWVLDSGSLTMRYHLAAWDEETVGGPTAVISHFQVHHPADAKTAFSVFRNWCEERAVVLVSCRLGHDRLLESGFLEAAGFRFIELNYRPELVRLRSLDLGVTESMEIHKAVEEDCALLADMASHVFRAGRFHSDPMISPTIGDRRYRVWIENAFRNPWQTVLRCTDGGVVVAFFVVEARGSTGRFWSLVGLAPGLAGRGLGTQVWRSLLRFHQQEGVDQISTSISSLNVPVLNLYVKLGFRFPPPEMTLHWCPRGPVGMPG